MTKPTEESMRQRLPLPVRRPRMVLAIGLLVLVVCAIVGAPVQSKLESGGYASAQVEAANRYVHEHFPGASPNFLVVVTAPRGDLESRANTYYVRSLLAEIRRRPDVGAAESWLDGPAASQLRSTDGRVGIVAVDLRGNDTATQNSAAAIRKSLPNEMDDLKIAVGGPAAEFEDIATQIAHDLKIAEAIALPITLLLLLLVFRNLIAALLPVVIGAFSLVVTLAVLRLVAFFTDVSIFALNMTTGLGLALAIDYSLFLVARYREELGNGRSVEEATRITMASAGRTVLFSALIVASALAALVVYQPYFLRSFAFAGVAVVLASALAAVLLLPAAFKLLGKRLDVPLRLWSRGSDRRRVGIAEAARSREESWFRLEMRVMRRPLVAAALSILFLGILVLPFLHAKLAYPDYRVLPKSAPSYSVGQLLDREFGPGLMGGTAIALPGYHGSTAAYARHLSSVSGVSSVTASTGVYTDGHLGAADAKPMSNDSGTYVIVNTRVSPMSHEAGTIVAALKHTPAPSYAVFGGTASVYEDALHELGSRTPIALGLAVGAALILLFMFTGSVVLPIKAVVLNLFSLTATFGAMVWVFQDGHLSGLLGFTPTGTINANMPPLIFCLAFGISMDYEVFLLSRVREQWLVSERGPEDTTRAIARGVAKSAGIFTAAALLMSVVFLAISTSGVSSMKMFGLGLALAVIVDAAVIRIFLAPALMRFMGKYNWWSPKPLAQLHAKFGPDQRRDVVSSPATTNVQATLVGRAQ
jgi:putative drug exporter of the RND superfamily